MTDYSYGEEMKSLDEGAYLDDTVKFNGKWYAFSSGIVSDSSSN